MVFLILSLRHIINYKVLKQLRLISGIRHCLRHIINYKVLKRNMRPLKNEVSLRHIINYKVLKLSAIVSAVNTV